MTDWAPKRFWTSADVVEEEGGFGVALDGRRVRTPAKAGLIVPTRALAQAVAAEWDAQAEKVDPMSMPMTQAANSAIDKLGLQRIEVADMLADYGDADLLCYRADSPDALVDRQAMIWTPYLDWAAEVLGARLHERTGLMHVPQDAGALTQLRRQVHQLSDFELAAFHDLVALSGSLILAFAAIHDMQPPEDLWQVSRLDETWQEEQWGADDEAQQTAERKRTAFLRAYRFYRLTRSA
ncbi:ATP12 family chaperone protein [Puniceibacterium sp. IMCC21224]|uniref:ATP12 family chaperone protein n=1 Tax=Puniceibacterium sp. IMCC21224 TaxID=1618204 RepID=UPI00064DD49B|nr:ATP12 family protein [Puniceibacterium sp. IMCC21224]KMK68231.1 chaperone required for the assembly of F1-ATPase [Puniceibacterium sp. IMCC21224]